MTNRVYMSDTMSISASACAIFCSEETCGRPPNRYDILSVGVVEAMGKSAIEVLWGPMVRAITRGNLCGVGLLVTVR